MYVCVCMGVTFSMSEDIEMYVTTDFVLLYFYRMLTFIKALHPLLCV